jgi:hypothetical protein
LAGEGLVWNGVKKFEVGLLTPCTASEVGVGVDVAKVEALTMVEVEEVGEGYLGQSLWRSLPYLSQCSRYLSRVMPQLLQAIQRVRFDHVVA